MPHLLWIIVVWVMGAEAKTSEWGPFDVSFAETGGFPKKVSLRYADECKSAEGLGKGAVAAFESATGCVYSEQSVQEFFSKKFGIGPESLNDFYQDALIAESLKNLQTGRNADTARQQLAESFFEKVSKGYEPSDAEMLTEAGNTLFVAERALHKIFLLLAQREYDQISSQDLQIELNHLVEHGAPHLAYHFQETVDELAELVDDYKDSSENFEDLARSASRAVTRTRVASILKSRTHEQVSDLSAEVNRIESHLNHLRIDGSLSKDERVRVYDELLVANPEAMDEAIFGIDAKAAGTRADPKIHVTENAVLAKGYCLLDSMTHKSKGTDELTGLAVDVAQTVATAGMGAIVVRTLKGAAGAARMSQAAMRTLQAVKVGSRVVGASAVAGAGKSLAATYQNCKELERSLNLAFVEMAKEQAVPNLIEARDLAIAQCDRETRLSAAGLGVTVALAGAGFGTSSAASAVRAGVLAKVGEIFSQKGGAAVASLGLMTPAFVDTCLKEGLDRRKCWNTLGRMTIVALAQKQTGLQQSRFASVAELRKSLLATPAQAPAPVQPAAPVAQPASPPAAVVTAQPVAQPRVGKRSASEITSGARTAKSVGDLDPALPPSSTAEAPKGKSSKDIRGVPAERVLLPALPEKTGGGDGL